MESGRFISKFSNQLIYTYGDTNKFLTKLEERRTFSPNRTAQLALSTDIDFPSSHTPSHNSYFHVM